MAEYGPGLTFGQCCNLDKERIKHALQGELMVGEDEDGGFVYEKAPKADCDKYILEAYDSCVFQAKAAMDSGRALDRLFEEVTGEKAHEKHFRRYMEIAEEERQEFQDYHYESDGPELTVLKGGQS